ncbi:MAG TPA: hypothetical protein VK933_09890 [Longimicrobiales bacterium]|nr:hypothetical protein [Longimicrobiales bacterium]
MPGLKGSSKSRGGEYTFRVSDVVDVPLRGTVLRLRVVEGTPSMSDLAVGSRLRLRSPAGAERLVTIQGYAVSSGKATQDRLDRVRELDVRISDDEATTDGAVEIGWMASGPAT